MTIHFFFQQRYSDHSELQIEKLKTNTLIDYSITPYMENEKIHKNLKQKKKQ